MPGPAQRTASNHAPRVPTTTAVAVLPQPARAGSWVHLIVRVSGATGHTPTGTVALRDGSLLLGTPTLRGGRATLKVQLFSAGRHEVRASYEGDEEMARSEGICMAAVLEQARVLLSVTPDARRAEALTLEACIHGRWDSPPCSGSVLFECDGEPVGESALHAGAATLMYSPPPGDHAISAVYLGDERYAGARSEPLAIHG
ncbi:MAG TPA: Ig-like domain-containing protein [Candidatus Dormibacteraeota bacterium]